MINYLPAVSERVKHSGQWSDRTFMLWISQFESLLATTEPTKTSDLQDLLESMRQLNGFRSKPNPEQYEFVENLETLARRLNLPIDAGIAIDELLRLGAPKITEVPVLLSTTWEYLMNEYEYQSRMPLTFEQLQLAIAYVEERKLNVPYHVYDHVTRELHRMYVPQKK